MFAIAVITVMVLAVRIPGIGKEINGARGWIEIGGFSMQPAEYLKNYGCLVSVLYFSTATKDN